MLNEQTKAGEMVLAYADDAGLRVRGSEPLGVDRQGAGRRGRGHVGQATQCDRCDAVHGGGVGRQALAACQGRSVCGFPQHAGG